MTLPDSIKEYEEFVYTLQERFSQIKTSTLVVKRLGAQLAMIQGALTFEKDIRLFVRERVNFEEGLIIGYSYEIVQADNTLYYYDSQPHPDDTRLASTHPHHKHVPPEIKHNRIPAPDIRFDSPNLPFLIQEIITNLLQ